MRLFYTNGRQDARGPRRLDGRLVDHRWGGHTPPVPAVSVITPTYDHAPFLGQCIESVLGQTFPSWEQIIVDDGSRDGTSDVARRYGDPRIRYVRQDNVGLARLPETYNRALSMCRAPLVAILEGDDYWPPDKLQALEPAFEDPGVVLAYGITEVVGQGRAGFPRHIPGPDFLRAFAPDVATNTPPGRAAAMTRRESARGSYFTWTMERHFARGYRQARAATAPRASGRA